MYVVFGLIEELPTGGGGSSVALSGEAPGLMVTSEAQPHGTVPLSG